MAHIHIVDDYDRRFVIDPITRKLTNQTPEKNTLVQNDHNSERFTFELPRIIEGHDMCTCNSVQVHYINIDSTTKAQSVGVYPVDDLRVDPENDNVVLCSWLVSQNATKHKGLLSFVVRFVCTTEGNIDYAWNTAVCSDVMISDGIYNSDIVMEEYTDVLSEFEARITALEQAVVGIPEIHVMRFDNGDESGVTIFVEKTNADGDVIDETATVYDSKIEIDTTLSVAGKAADAKAVGDRLANISGGNAGPSGESYVLPVATADTLGGIKAEPATDGDTQPVRIGEDGMLYTAPGSGGGEVWETIIDYTVPEDCSQVLLTTDINGNPFSLKRAIAVCLVYPLAEPAAWPLRCVFDSQCTAVYGSQHFWNGLPTSPNTAGKYAGFKLDVCKTNDGISVVNGESIATADIKEDGTYTMNPSSVYQRYYNGSLSPVATGITAFGVGSYKTAVGAGTRIKLLGVRE